MEILLCLLIIIGLSALGFALDPGVSNDHMGNGECELNCKNKRDSKDKENII